MNYILWKLELRIFFLNNFLLRSWKIGVRWSRSLLSSFNLRKFFWKVSCRWEMLGIFIQSWKISRSIVFLREINICVYSCWKDFLICILFYSFLKCGIGVYINNWLRFSMWVAHRVIDIIIFGLLIRRFWLCRTF